MTSLDSQVSDAERFRNSEPLLVRCRGCKGQMSFSPIWEREVSCTLSRAIGRSNQLLGHVHTVVDTATLWPYLSSVQPPNRCSQSADATRSPNTRVYRAVLRRVDCLQRCNVWTPDAFDERVWSSLRTAGVSRQGPDRVLGHRTVQSAALFFDVVRRGEGQEGSDWECSFWYAPPCFFSFSKRSRRV